MTSIQEMFHIRLYDIVPSDFNHRNNGGSDISLSLPVIHFYAGKCKHITEFGVRNGYSCVALMFGVGKEGKLISYDITHTDFINEFKEVCKNEGYNWIFNQKSTIDEDLNIEETDLLFIDTVHTRNHVDRELRQVSRVRKYIIFHDSSTCYNQDSSSDHTMEGIGVSIENLLATNQWDIEYQTYTNNGLMILERNDRNSIDMKPIHIWKNNRFERVGEVKKELKCEVKEVEPISE